MSKKYKSNRNGLNLEEDDISYYEKNGEEIVIDETAIFSKEELMAIFTKEFNIPFHLKDNIAHIKIYLLNRINKPVTIVWVNFLHSMNFLEDYLFEFTHMLLEVQRDNPNLTLVGLK